MSLKVSINDIARRVKCTPSSVSLVLNNSPLPSEKMRKKVRKAAAELGYVPNRLAKSLLKGRTNTLGLIMPYSHDLGFSAYLDAVNDYALERNYQVEVHFHKWSTKEEDRILNYLAETRVDGVIIYANRVSYANVEATTLLKNLGVPLVGVNTRQEENSPFTSMVINDMKTGAYDLGVYVANQGHRKVDWLTNDPNAVTSVLMQDFQQGMDSVANGCETHPHGLNPEEFIPYEDVAKIGMKSQTEQEQLAQVASKYVKQRSESSGTIVIASNRMLAWKLMTVLYQDRLRCPDDVSIACFGGSGISDLGIVPVTAFETPTALRAEKSVSTLLAAIEGDPVPPVIPILGEVVVRSSVKNILPAS